MIDYALPLAQEHPVVTAAICLFVVAVIVDIIRHAVRGR